MHATHSYNTSWEKVRRLFPNNTGSTVLDLGCGDGSIVASLLAEHDVWGLDENAEAVKIAYAKGLHAVKGSVEQPFPFPDGQVDAVLALDILEHVSDLGHVFREIGRVVKPHGAMIISLPNHFDLRTRLEILFGKGIIKWSQRQYETKAWEYAHIRFWTLRELKAMLHEFGWYPEVWQFNFMGQGLFPTRLVPKWKRRWLTRRWPGLFSGKFVVRCRRQQPHAAETIIIDETPKDF